MRNFEIFCHTYQGSLGVIKIFSSWNSLPVFFFFFFFFKKFVSSQSFYWQKFKCYFIVITILNSYGLHKFWFIIMSVCVGVGGSEHEYSDLKRCVLCLLPKSSLIKKWISNDLLCTGFTAIIREFKTFFFFFFSNQQCTR